MILTCLSSLMHIKSYVKVIKAGRVVLDSKYNDIYKEYKLERETCSYEDFLLPRVKYFQLFDILNTLFSILCIVFGLLTIIILYIYREEFCAESKLIQLGIIIWSILAVYYGLKDLFVTLNNQRFLLLLLSCLLTILLYVPVVHYMNKDSLKTYISSDNSLKYNEEKNLIYEIVELDDVDDFEITNLKRRIILSISGNDSKKLLKKAIRVNAEFRTIYRDKLGEEKIINITPSELKEIYFQTKSDLDILLEFIKLDYNDKDKVYDDGKNIVIELWENENISYPIQSEQKKISIRLAEFTAQEAKFYNVVYFDRGLKIRCIFDNNQFIEHILSLEEIKSNKIDDADIGKSENMSSSLLEIFSN